jgi:hypothetical protein
MRLIIFSATSLVKMFGKGMVQVFRLSKQNKDLKDILKE